MVDSLNYSYDHGELSNSQKEAIITLIEKKDKDKLVFVEVETNLTYQCGCKNRVKSYC